MTPSIASDIAAVNRFMSITRQQILKYIPYKPGSNPTNSFKILLTIYNNPKLTVSAIKRAHNSFSYTIDKNVSHLLQCGLIEPKNKPYWITIIKAWRVDKGYVITKAGENVIFRLFEQVYEEKSEIDHKKAS